MAERPDSGIFTQPWLCSTVRSYETSCSDASNISVSDAGFGDRISVEGVDLYGIKIGWYAVGESLGDPSAVRTEEPCGGDPLFGEDSLERIERAFWTMGYVSELPPGVRTYQLQGIWGEDLVSMKIPISSFRWFSSYGGADRNTPRTHDQRDPKIGDLLYIPNTGVFYEVVDVKKWDDSFGLSPRLWSVTARVAKDSKRTVSDDLTIPEDDPVRQMSPSALPDDKPTDDCLQLRPEELPSDDGKVDMFDWTWNEKDSRH